MSNTARDIGEDLTDLAVQIDQYGYARILNALPPQEMACVAERISHAITTASAETGRLESRGTAYAARNVLDIFPEAAQLWQTPRLQSLLHRVLGPDFGLVRVLFFDKPPGRTWSLGWHKDMTIAVADNSLSGSVFTNPTRKSGVPHVIAPPAILGQMLTLRLHLDAATKENGPLIVLPGSHREAHPEIDGAAIDTIYAQPGDVLAMRPLLLHASGNSSPNTVQHRRILHYEFAASDQLPDGYQWYEFLT